MSLGAQARGAKGVVISGENSNSSLQDASDLIRSL